jgi:hypothetical protein
MRSPLPAAVALAALAALAAGCTAGGSDAGAITVRDSSGVAIVTNDLTQLTSACTIAGEPTLSIGVEEGEEAYMLARLAGAARLSDGRIMIAERSTHSVRYYDASGRHLLSSGRRGDGPGEFREPFYLHVIPGDTVYVGDFRPFRFLVFGPDGKWVRTVTPDPMEINTPASRGVLDDGRFVMSRSNPRTGGFLPDTVVVRGYDRDGRERDTVTAMAHARYGVAGATPNFYVFPFFESFSYMRAGGDRIVIAHGATPEIRVHRATAGYPLATVVRWEAGDRTIRPADVEAEKARIRASYANVPPAMRDRMLDAEVGDRRPVAERFPAFQSLTLARDGRLWIRDFVRPGDEGPHRWTAFTPDGRFDCRLETPRFAEYLEFGADYLLVREPDSLDVERVRLYPITRR